MPDRSTDIQALRKGDEAAWTFFLGSVTPNLERIVRNVARRNGVTPSTWDVEETVAVIIATVFPRIQSGMVDRTPEQYVFSVAGKISIDQYNKRSKKISHLSKDAAKPIYYSDPLPDKGDGELLGSYLEQNAKNKVYGNDIDKITLYDFFRDYRQSLLRWGQQHLAIIAEQESPSGGVNDPYLQIGCLDLFFHQYGNEQDRVGYLGVEVPRQYHRIRERALQLIVSGLKKPHREVCLVELLEVFSEGLVYAWQYASGGCLPYLHDPLLINDQLSGSAEIHRRIHAEILKCPSCCFWVGKTRSEIEATPMVQTVVQQTIRTIRKSL
jgi:hypothetical protein